LTSNCSIELFLGVLQGINILIWWHSQYSWIGLTLIAPFNLKTTTNMISELTCCTISFFNCCTILSLSCCLYHPLHKQIPLPTLLCMRGQLNAMLWHHREECSWQWREDVILIVNAATLVAAMTTEEDRLHPEY
jgi:hypothetical protein